MPPLKGLIYFDPLSHALRRGLKNPARRSGLVFSQGVLFCRPKTSSHADTEILGTATKFLGAFSPWGPNLRRFLIVCLFLSLVPLVFAQPRRTPPPAPVLRTPTGEKGLVELERQILEAIRERNTDKLDAILAPDFLYVSPRKPDLRRQEFLSQVKSSTSDMEWLGAEEMKIHLYGDVAVVTGIQNEKVRSEKTGLQTGDKSFTDVFRRRQGRWELALAFRADMPATPVKK